MVVTQIIRTGRLGHRKTPKDLSWLVDVEAPQLSREEKERLTREEEEIAAKMAAFPLH